MKLFLTASNNVTSACGRMVATWLMGAALFLSFPAFAASEYCDQPDPDVDCIDPAFEPGSSLYSGEISTENTVGDIKAGEPLDIADDGEFDGIYQCDVTPTAKGTSGKAYVTINGDAETGNMIFVLAGLDPNTDSFAGYGKGKFSGTQLSGTTSKGGTFSALFTMGVDAQGYAQATATGKVHVKGFDTALKPVEWDVSFKCVSIW